MNIQNLLSNSFDGCGLSSDSPFTVSASSMFQDKLIVKISSNQIVAEYMVPAGTNHREYVAGQLKYP